MRVWQRAAGHLGAAERGAEVDDWSLARRPRAARRDARPARRRPTSGARRSRSSRCSPRPAIALAAAVPREARHRRRHPRGDLHALVDRRRVPRRRPRWTRPAAAQTYFTGWTGERILADLRNTLFRHLQRLSLGFYERNRAGVIISRLTNDVDALDQLVTDGVASLVQNTLTLIGTAALLFLLDWRLALATLSIVPAMAVATAIFRIRSSRAYRARARAARPGHRDARRGHRRHARRPGVHAGGREQQPTSAR